MRSPLSERLDWAALGRLIASVTMVTGYVMLGLPVGIVATAFSEEIHRREFVVTWGMLARVPLFSSLSAAEIAEVMDYLRARTVPTDTIIMRRGDIADCMFFIAAGEVEIETGIEPLKLSGKVGRTLVASTGPLVFEDHVPSLDVSEIA